jgi:hypothetical protein
MPKKLHFHRICVKIISFHLAQLMRVRVLYHDHCFDGAASAAFFTRFTREALYPGAEYAYTGMMHKASQIFEDELFDGDENAIVDFKYSANPKLTWWFDHHQSAFLSPEDGEHYHSRPWDRKFYDPDYKSCTKFIADIASEKFGYNAPDLAELVTWADIVDGAQYASAQDAVELKSAATQLVLVIEGVKGSGIIHRIIRLMTERKLDDIVADPEVQALYRPLYEQHIESIDIIRAAASCQDRAVFFDLVEKGLAGYNKFIPYYLFPESVYTVSVMVSSFRTKISVGSNPWAREEPRHNLATICERYGGGGHPRVGAISFEKDQVELARRVAREIAGELSRSPGPSGTG